MKVVVIKFEISRCTCKTSNIIECGRNKLCYEKEEICPCRNCYHKSVLISDSSAMPTYGTFVPAAIEFISRQFAFEQRVTTFGQNKLWLLLFVHFHAW